MRQCLKHIQALVRAQTELDVAGAVSAAAHAELGADGAAFVVRRGEECEYVDVRNPSPMLSAGIRFPLSACICGKVIETGETVAISEVEDDPMTRGAYFRAMGARSVLVVPIVGLEERVPIGSLLCYWNTRHAPTEGDIEVLEALACFAANFLSQVALVESLRRAREESEHRETQIAQLNKHLRNVINELDHRVRNNLSVVTMLAEETYRHSSPEQFMSSFRGRLRMLARAHDFLATVDWRGADMRHLVNVFVEPHAPSPQRLALDGSDVRLPRHAVFPMAASLHELATNAARHGAWSNAEGYVVLSWTLSEDQRLHLRWEERQSPSSMIEFKYGFGTSMALSLLQYEAKATTTLDASPSGVRFEADLSLEPMEEAAVPRAASRGEQAAAGEE